jgi:hypothetical protein
MTERVRPSDRAAWKRWAEDEFGPDSQAIAIATETAIQALIAGYQPIQAMDYARQAVASGRPPDAGLRPTTSARPGNDGRSGVLGFFGSLFRLAAFLLVLAIFAFIAWFAYVFFTGSMGL